MAQYIEKAMMRDDEEGGRRCVRLPHPHPSVNQNKPSSQQPLHHRPTLLLPLLIPLLMPLLPSVSAAPLDPPEDSRAIWKRWVPDVRERREIVDDNAQLYLMKYGYLPMSDMETGNLRTEEQFRAAIRTMQRFGHVPQTGLLDDATRALMLRPRCSLPDLQPGEGLLFICSIILRGIKVEGSAGVGVVRRIVTCECLRTGVS